MTLEQIFEKYGVSLKDSTGELRNAIDIFEDIYLKMNAAELKLLLFEISEEELNANIFDDARGRKYRGV
jgi:hypothetical protein